MVQAFPTQSRTTSSGRRGVSSFPIKTGDLLPAITATLMQQVGTADATVIDLTTATAVKFGMRNRATGATKVDAAGTIVSAVAGTVKYTWVSGDTDTAGTYDAEWQVMWPSSKPQTIPNGGYDTIVVGTGIAT